MGKSYSEDLRIRALGALDGGQKKSRVSRSFSIARSTLDDWIALRERTGGVKVVPKRPSCVAALSDTPSVHEFIQRHQHSTQQQMATAWEQETGHKLCAMTFSKSLRRLGYTRKKRVISTESVMRSSAVFFWSRSP